MAFKVIKDLGEAELGLLPISSQTVAVCDLLQLPAGGTTWTVCTSGSVFYTKKAIAMGAATSSDTTVLAYELTGREWVEADVANTVAANDNGDQMVLSSKTTVNNTHTNSTAKEACFTQRGIGSTTTKAVGHVIVGPGLINTAT